jgi:hypothetical protein
VVERDAAARPPQLMREIGIVPSDLLDRKYQALTRSANSKSQRGDTEAVSDVSPQAEHRPGDLAAPRRSIPNKQ